MEIETLISALEETIALLLDSTTSAWSGMDVDEIIRNLEIEIAKCRNAQKYDASRLAFLFAPTGAIQETAIDNGWGNEYMRLSTVIDQFTAN